MVWGRLHKLENSNKKAVTKRRNKHGAYNLNSGMDHQWASPRINGILGKQENRCLSNFWHTFYWGNICQIKRVSEYHTIHPLKKPAMDQLW